MKSKFLFLPTLKINVLRSFFAGIVFSLFYLFNPEMHPPLYVYLLTPFFFPAFLLFFWALSFALGLFKLGGIGRLLMAFFAVPGDPLLFILFKIKPEWQPVEKFNIINFTGLFLVYSDGTIAKNIENTENNNGPCPFKGRISVHKDTKWGGFDFPTTEIAFEIHDDWKVYHKGSKYGWIDREGYIHKNPINGDVNLDATLSDEKIAKLNYKSLYVGNDKVGDLI